VIARQCAIGNELESAGARNTISDPSPMSLDQSLSPRATVRGPSLRDRSDTP